MEEKTEKSNISPSELHTICTNSRILLVGMTGGIASGKSVVADILKKRGAKIIDSDILARQIVEPGKPAWKDIAGFFGGNILLNDNRINRKKLSDIVFQSPEKRKILESFTHPRIHREFIKETKRIAQKTPNAIILGIIPLLIETGMQAMFHKILLIHIPRKEQIKRLIKRNSIREEEAKRIIRAQMPIDEKMKHAHFVINNQGTMEQTEKEAIKVWKALKKLQLKN